MTDCFPTEHAVAPLLGALLRSGTVATPGPSSQQTATQMSQDTRVVYAIKDFLNQKDIAVSPIESAILSGAECLLIYGWLQALPELEDFIIELSKVRSRFLPPGQSSQLPSPAL